MAAIDPSQVHLALQAGESEPLAALRALNISLASGAPAPAHRVSPVLESRQLVLRLLGLHTASHMELDAAMRELVVDPLRSASHGAVRNRTIFVTSVLSADATCAASLGRCGAAEALCRALHPLSGGSELSETERHWAVIALSELAGHPASTGTTLRAVLRMGWLPAVAEALHPAAPADAAEEAEAAASPDQDAGHETALDAAREASPPAATSEPELGALGEPEDEPEGGPDAAAGR